MRSSGFAVAAGKGRSFWTEAVPEHAGAGTLGRKFSPRCHPERSEGSLIAWEMLRFAQHDKLGRNFRRGVLNEFRLHALWIFG
jgi:hypothetical protein